MRWHFARRPLWLLSHLLVVALVVTMVAFGLWQLRRLDERQAANALVESRAQVPPAAVEQVLPPASANGDEVEAAVDAVVHRRVLATGTYAGADSVLVDNRSYNGAPGGWVLTPLRLDDGSAVVVNRGFVGFTRSGELVAPPPPEGTVTVEGIVQASQQRGRFGATDPAEGRLDVLARADIGRIAAQVGYDVRPAYVQALGSSPPEPAPPPDEPALVPLAEPDLSDGPHLSYAVQWFIFTTIAVVGYPLILRRVARQEAAEHAAAGPGTGAGPDPGGPDGPDGPSGEDRPARDDGDGLDRELRDLLAAEGG